ncbi:hypothetical protein ALC56_12717 [Trachymyrmex septentrionalis]|uniref:Gustatory receptor n=1 Tax=Trachymyrmex septentrionalis TaxID=34720 RepID=A0A195EXM6_9HYME|nr:hypothetical protein ALC56_12717 [Trachymyrmex septentrionalis]
MFSLSLSKSREERVKSKIEERRWWLFHAIDFQSLMYPCFIFCRILGMHPYKINALLFEISKPYYILSTITVCVSCFCALIIIINISESFDLNQNIRKIIELISFYIIGNFITIITFVLSGPRIRLFKTLRQISSRLPPESYQKPSILIHAKDMFGFFFLLVYTLSYHNWHFSVLCLLYYNLVIFQINMLYINCVYVLKACFKKINNDLENLITKYDQPHLVRWFYHKQKNSFLLKELKALKKQHLKISESVQMLNIIFSPQLLATIIFIIIIITFELYFNMIDWRNGLSISWIRQISHRNVMPYVVFYAVKIALIVWVCEAGKNQAIKISTIVHDLLNNTNDEQIKHEVLKIFISVYFFYISYHDTFFTYRIEHLKYYKLCNISLF